MVLDTNRKVFFELLEAGLWERSVQLSRYENIDFHEIYRLAEEQSVLGLITAGIDHVIDVKIPKDKVLPFVGQTLQIERRNKAMNLFVVRLIELLNKDGVQALLVKGQGIAQCYNRPMWRTCGDVDLLLSGVNYQKAKDILVPRASAVETEYTHFKHLGMTIDGWVVELHGTLHSRLSARVDREIDKVQNIVFDCGYVRTWENGNTRVFLPAPDYDVIFVFTHILHHFFFEGIGLRQICDWCRLIWTYKDSLDIELLEKRLRSMGLMSEWKAFAAFSVKYLGMPLDATPLLDRSNTQNLKKHICKADKICSFILEVGNFGHNRRRDYSGMSYLRRKFVSFWGRLSDMLRHFTLFPRDSIVFFGGVIKSGLHAAVRGE